MIRHTTRTKTWKYMLMKSRRRELGLSGDGLRQRVLALLPKDVKPPSRSTFYLYERPSFTPSAVVVREAIAAALKLDPEDLYR